MNLALLNRGYGPNSGIISPDKTQFIVNIPKNASSYILSWAQAHNWFTAVLSDDNWLEINELIVVLRDPLQRWVSGLAQYLKTYILCPVGPNGPVFPGMHYSKDDYGMSADDFIAGYNQNTERLIFDNVYRFDDHVWPQIDFVQHLRPDLPRKYFLINPEFNVKFGNYLGLTPMSGLDKNNGNDNEDTKKLNSFIKQRLNIRPELVDRVKRAYAIDYEFIEKCKIT